MTPAWLLGLLLVPVIRWLHRGGPQRRVVPVASLTLWRRAAVTGAAAGGRQPPDPAWRRRALITALLALALAGPRSAVQVDRVTLWVDDSLSMLTRENGVSRLTRGLELAAAELAGRPGVAIEVRALGRPWEARTALDAKTVSGLLAAAGQQEPAPPPAALWRGDREQWLVTDGASDVSEKAAYSRVIRVGETRRNVGLLRLSARRSLEDSERLDVELEARNGGDAAEERLVVLADASGEIARSTLRIAPGESATVSATAPFSSRLTADLDPADALEADDSISLDTSQLAAKRVHVDPACPASLVTVLGAHPVLTLAGDDADADLLVNCGESGEPGSKPILKFRRDGSPQAVDGPLLWSSTVDSSSRRLGAFPLRTAGRLAPPTDRDVVLLASGTSPLVVRRAGGAATVIETSLDIEPNASDDPASLPLLVAFLIDQAFSASLLDAVAATAREPDAVMVVPRAVATTVEAPSATPAVAGSRSWSRPLLVVALLALLWELIVLLRRVRRERAEAGAWSQ